MFVRMRDISDRFDTALARKLEYLRALRHPKTRLAEEYLQICVGFSDERQKLYRLVLQMDSDEEPKRCEVQDLSYTLFRKIASVMGLTRIDALAADNGFFVYNPHKPRILVIAPEGAKLTYWLITGIRMRAMELHVIGKLVRIGYLFDHTAYIQPKVMDHDEYEHLLELVGREHEELNQKGGGEHGFS
jgi:hypothetical protein